MLRYHQVNKNKFLILGYFIFSAFIIYEIYEEKDFFLCLIIPTYHNIFKNNFKKSGLNQTYFWVFDKQETDSNVTEYSGFNYWTGYGADIKIYDDLKLSKEEYLLQKDICFYRVEFDSTFFINQINDSTFYYAYKKNNKEFILDIFHRNQNINIVLTQISNQEEYRTINVALKMLKGFF